MEQDVVIAAARRTPIGRLNGSLASRSAASLGAPVIAALLADAGLEGGDLDEVILGQVLTGGAGQNPARRLMCQL
jgi:acetyl-CoA C-acetyltransferase